MGFMGNPDGAAMTWREMGTRDFIWLAALGTASRGPAALDDICLAVEHITVGQWLPMGELLCASVDEMIRGGNLGAAADGRLVPTARGLETLVLLLLQPTARPTSVFGQVGLRLKLAFLDLLETTERRHVLDGLIGQYEEELAGHWFGKAGRAARGGFGELWRCHDLDRLRRDVALLRSMAGLVASPPVAH